MFADLVVVDGVVVLGRVVVLIAGACLAVVICVFRSVCCWLHFAAIAAATSNVVFVGHVATRRSTVHAYHEIANTRCIRHED